MSEAERTAGTEAGQDRREDAPRLSAERPDAPGPLDGIVVADFSRVLAGPYAAQILGDLGAEVIKVESPHGDDTRYWQPPTYRGESVYYQTFNRNKHAIALDFADEEDRDTAFRIAARADVVLHNFKPGSIEKFGLGYEDVAAANPSVVYAHITGFGSKGFGATMPGYDVLVQGMAGFMDMTGTPDGPPTRAGMSLFDVTTGMMTALGICAALRHRERTGEGQLIENNLMANAMFTMIGQYQDAAVGGDPHRTGNDHNSLFPYGPFPTSDGEIIVAAATNGQFARLCRVMGLEGLESDERFDTAEKRNLDRESLRPILEEAFRTRDRAAWFTALHEAGLPVAPVQGVREGLESARKIGIDPVWVTEEDPDLPMVRNPLTMSRTPASFRKVPPAIDADRGAVLAWLEAAEDSAAR